MPANRKHKKPSRTDATTPRTKTALALALAALAIAAAAKIGAGPSTGLLLLTCGTLLAIRAARKQ